MKEPTDCILWNEPEKISSEEFSGFDVVEKYVDTSHWERSLLKCRECGQLYFHEFYEEVDWEDGEDPQYWTYIPVESDEEIALLKKTTFVELLQFFPRLQKDFPKSAKKPKIFWAKRSPSSMDDPIYGNVEQGKEHIGGRIAKKKKSIPEIGAVKTVPRDKIKVDPYAKALSSSDQMRPYIELFTAIYSKDEKALEIAREKVDALPLEERYIWRILEALSWGFSDFDNETVRIDLECLSDADLQKLNGVTRNIQLTRLTQLCLFLQELCGPETMKRLMENAVEAALCIGMSEGGDEEVH